MSLGLGCLPSFFFFAPYPFPFFLFLRFRPFVPPPVSPTAFLFPRGSAGLLVSGGLDPALFFGPRVSPVPLFFFLPIMSLSPPLWFVNLCFESIRLVLFYLALPPSLTPAFSTYGQHLLMRSSLDSLSTPLLPPPSDPFFVFGCADRVATPPIGKIPPLPLPYFVHFSVASVDFFRFFSWSVFLSTRFLFFSIVLSFTHQPTCYFCQACRHPFFFTVVIFFPT